MYFPQYIWFILSMAIVSSILTTDTLTVDYLFIEFRYWLKYNKTHLIGQNKNIIFCVSHLYTHLQIYSKYHISV